MYPLKHLSKLCPSSPLNFPFTARFFPIGSANKKVALRNLSYI